MNRRCRKYIFLISLFLLTLQYSCNGGKLKKEAASSDSGNEELVAVPIEEEKVEYLQKTHIPVISSYYMKGEIDGKYAFTMNFTVDSGKVDGFYRYKGKKDEILLKGKIDDSNIRLEETIYNEQESIYVSNGAYFEGTFDYESGKITGTWHSADSVRILPFEIVNYYEKGYPQFEFRVDLKKETYESGYVSLNITELYIQNKGINANFTVDARPVESTYAIYQEDFNFDGYPDIAMMEFIPSYPPNRFIFWLYDPDEEMYFPTDILDDVYTLPDINYTDSTTTTCTSWRGDLYEQTYKFDGEKWTLIKSETSDISG